MKNFAHLGPFSDLVDAATAQGPLFPDNFVSLDAARQVLRFSLGDEQPAGIESHRTWERDGLAGEDVSWSVGFGSRAHAIVLKPANASGRLPGIVALYDHGHFKFYGKEKIADGIEGPLAAVQPFRDKYYGGRAFANLLAREGFVVLIHDTFLWGSRKFPLANIADADLVLADAAGAALGHGDIDRDILRYHGAAYLYENQIAKYLTLLGSSLAAITAYEDRVALNYLATRREVDAKSIGCIGFSGGGLRASMLGTTADGVGARVVTGMMATYPALIDRHIAPHTWMMFPPGWSRIGDYPDIAAAAAPAPLLVQNALEDQMFTEKGMRDADARIAAYYARAGNPSAYRGTFYPGPHRFDVAMQEEAFAWLKERLSR